MSSAMNYGNTGVPVSPLAFYVPPEAKWWFIGSLVVFIIAIHIHAINRD